MTQQQTETPSGSPSVAAAAMPDAGTAVTKIIVAIHGIGSQTRSDTIRTVASRFGDRCTPRLPMMPLGYFNVANTAQVKLSYLNPGKHDAYLKNVGFAEVFWADIPESVVKQDDLLEETKAWGRTVVSRAEASYNANVPEDERKLKPADFDMGIGVVDEIVETIGVMENLLAVAEKAGIFKFDLAPLLRDYIGDVQLVADFPFQRDRILYRFHSALGKIVAAFAEHNKGLSIASRPEIYIVAHSEGTVISFLAMLEAFSGKMAKDPEGKEADYDSSVWIRDVRGYMTIGSPIDKHLLLWPALWKDVTTKIASRAEADGSIVFERAGQAALTLPQKIQWRNYYDHGDPIGFQLDTAVAFLREEQCGSFEFDTSKHDFGFSRYPLPGKAHTDYWTDEAVFNHFIDDVVWPKSLGDNKTKPPQDKLFQGHICMMLPFLLVFLLHFAAVFALYKGITAFSKNTVLVHLPLQISLLSVLLTCITVTARLPRLVKPNGLRWPVSALVSFAIGAACIYLLCDDVLHYLCGPFTAWLGNSVDTLKLEHIVLLAVAAFIASTGWWAPRKAAYGRRWLIGTGVVLIGYIVVVRLLQSQSLSNSDSPAWPTMLAGLAFLYLWWLGILLFDLAFIWHRYIRHSVAVDTLRQWKRGRDAEPRSISKLWGRPKPSAT
jgi:hypothetical protein